VAVGPLAEDIYVTKDECRLLHEKMDKRFDEQKEQIHEHDLQAKEILNQVDCVEDKTDRLEDKMVNLVDLQKQIMEERKFYQSLILRLVMVGSTVLFALLGLKIAGISV
jgi:hypothetical protein